MARLRRRASAGGLAVLGGATQLASLGCAVDPTQDIEALEQGSWSQDQGQRNTAMVSFLGSSWTTCKFPNTRFGCGSWETFIKVRVRPVAGADLNWKRVGVTFRSPYESLDRTALGNYHTRLSNGDEEWHVPVAQGYSQTPIIFDVWYQDGRGNTYLDDNAGEFHVVNPSGQGSYIVRAEPWLNTVSVGPDGVRGKISVQVADLDYDKELVLIATTDDWATIQELGMGAPGEKNRFSWAEDFPWSGYERWQIDLDLPAASRLRYAIAYRHGVKNGAVRYEFWDNNWGQNYLVEAATP